MSEKLFDFVLMIASVVIGIAKLVNLEGSKLVVRVFILLDWIIDQFVKPVRWLLRIINEEKFNYYAAMESQHEDLTELQVLNSINQVKDHAQSTNAWTGAHTDQINNLCRILFEEHGWKEEQIHGHINKVLEPIGLSVNVPDSDPDITL